MPFIIGVDMGGVCCDKKEDGRDLFNIPNVLESLNALKKAGHTLILVSFCGQARAKNMYYTLLGKYPDVFDKCIYVKKPRYKGLVCEKEGIQVMIDDRPDVLEKITCGTKLLLFGSKKSNIKNQIPVENWEQCLKIINNLDCKKIQINDHDLSNCAWTFVG